jgi:ferredoxin-NADP reductase
LDTHAIEELRVPRDADFYLCGPSAFMNDLAVELGN